MNFNYRDFFIHNDDLHIIKEQLSIVDEMSVSKEDALIPNAKDVWHAWVSGSNEQKIASTLKINVKTVEKIIYICLMHTDENKSVPEIATELSLSKKTVDRVLSNTLGSEWKRDLDIHIISDAEKIYGYHKNGKTPDEIVVLVNKEKEERDLENITVDRAKLVIQIIDIAKEQMDTDKKINASKIHKKIGEKISYETIIRLIKKLELGKVRYLHTFTKEQDAFILFNYLQRQLFSEIAKLFNEKFSTVPIKLNIRPTSIHTRLTHSILDIKGKGESEISKEVLELLGMYKDTYFQAVNIEDPKTKNLLTNYIPPETVGGRDRTGTGTNRDMSAHLGTVQTNFNTMLPPYYKS
jgi:DNA-binding CsgD family transcriptional regulator